MNICILFLNENNVTDQQNSYKWNKQYFVDLPTESGIWWFNHISDVLYEGKDAMEKNNLTQKLTFPLYSTVTIGLWAWLLQLFRFLPVVRQIGYWLELFSGLYNISKVSWRF